MRKRFGVIDIGTLKVKCQVVEVLPSGWIETLHQSNKMTLLGAHLDKDNRPRREYLEKTLAELRRCKKVLEREKVSRVRVVSTHALREMGKVGQEVAGEIKEKTGLSVEIISAREEAGLFYRAVLADFQTKDDFTIVDVGGGSVQVLIGNKSKLKDFFLLKTGTITLWDKFTPRHEGTDFPTRAEIRRMKDYVLAQLQLVPGGIKTPVIYGSSCVIDVFKGIPVKLSPYSKSPTHPYKVTVADMEKFLDRVWEIPYDIREKQFVSPTPKYMWGIDNAFLNVVELAKKVAAPYVIPSNANINQGLIMSLI